MNWCSSAEHTSSINVSYNEADPGMDLPCGKGWVKRAKASAMAVLISDVFMIVEL